ncbi:hypothetical protein QFC24_004954 [Naganishia onofrii]|uniref:Uncharacterized protein n=1 Tax=Naganishia onofrii TaxID=1851511 RepID=A0ACC2XC96_9TREE|nr:hypothetical protein QFC24_004954 [Naganishia onofrii]
MFSWKGVQGLLDESAALDNDDEEGGSDEDAQVVDAPTRGHAGDISFTGSELYPDDGYARGTSPTGGPTYGSTGPTTPASSRFGNHQIATTQAGLQSATSMRTDPGIRQRNRQVSRQSLLAVFNSPVSERHQGNEVRSSGVGRHFIADTRSPTRLRFDNASTSQRDGLKQRRADTDVTIRPARPTGSPSSHQTTRRNSSSSDSDTESSSGQSTDTYISRNIESQSTQEEQVLSSSPTQLDIPTPITTHPTHLPTRKPREQGTLGFQAGDVTVLVLWIGSSMAGLAWLKQWVNNPSFNTGWRAGCSMAAVTLFTVVVKEGGFAKLGEVLLIVVVGASISNFVCFTLWPQSATTKLQTSIATTLDSFSTLFRLLNATFLLDRPPNDASYASLQTAAQSHSAAFTQLKADLAEAQHERLLDRRINAKQRERYAAVTDSLTRLAQHLTGMRGGTGLQSDLLRGSKQGILEVNSASSSDSDDKEGTDGPRNRDAGKQRDGEMHVKRKLRGDHDLSKAGNLFWAFRDEVAEEMRQLTDLSCKVLHDVKLAMTDLNSSADHSALLHADHALLQSALKVFTTTTIHAINKLYHGTLRKPDSAIFDLPHASDNGSNEAVYLIYFFIFTLEEFVREEIQLVEAMCEVITPLRAIASDLQPPVFPKRDKNNPNTLTTPSHATLTKREKIYQALWALQARLRENDIKYALKVGLGTVVLASPAFSTRYRDTFLEFRGEWALIAFWATMSPSIGSTNL